MKKDFNVEIKNFNGESIKLEGDNVLTLKDVCVGALLANYEEEKNLSGEEKFKRSLLAEKVYLSDGEIDVAIEDITLMKKLVGKRYSAIIVGQSFKLLEN